ncbi:MAG: hypothetical protein KGI59_00865 [Patescibacteria group bacterium]|nr:hypothetical protein [Patescibacteria group bacterium]MDE2172594.1 hypothetical protein [Patescibacteria group bacterium]
MSDRVEEVFKSLVSGQMPTPVRLSEVDEADGDAIGSSPIQEKEWTPEDAGLSLKTD